MATKVLISLPEPFLEEVDRIAQEEHRTRSELVREAMRLYIAQRRADHAPRLDPRVRRAVAIQDALSRVSPGVGEDSTDELRRWRRSR